eukprot:Opistho-1_new@107331
MPHEMTGAPTGQPDSIYISIYYVTLETPLPACARRLILRTTAPDQSAAETETGHGSTGGRLLHPATSMTAPVRRRPFYRSLYFLVLAAIVAGGLIGHLWPELGESLKPLGDGFIKLVKMIIAPVIFLTITTGIAGMRDLKQIAHVLCVDT